MAITYGTWACKSVALLTICWGIVGCGGGRPTYEVHGRVTLDGEPVEDGMIRFQSSDINDAAAGGPIANGEFRFQSSAGTKRVEIRASRPLPEDQQTEPELGLLYEDYLPSRYNRDSELSVEVREDGENDFHFELSGNP